MTTNAYTFAADEATMRWEEPYLTRGLNVKAAAIIPAGIYRGCRLAGTATNCELQVASDPTWLDHVVHYRTATGYALTLRHLGALLFDLTAYAGQTVIVAVYATYAVGVATTAFIRIYTLSEYNAAAEKAELVVLGRVSVSAGLPITVIEYTGRVVAALNEAPGAAQPFELLRNHGFESGVLAAAGTYAAHFWEKRVTVGTASWVLVSSPVPSGSLKAMSLNVTSGPVTGALLQYLHAPVRPGQLLRLTLKMRVDVGATGGTLTLAYNFTDNSGAATGTVSISLDAATTTASAYVTIERTLVVPNSVTHLRSLSVTATGLTYVGTGSVFYLDDFQLHLLEHHPLTETPDGSTARMMIGGRLLLEDPTAAVPQSSGALLSHDQGAGSLIGSDRTGSGALLLNWLGNLLLGGGMNASPSTARMTINREAATTYTLAYQWGIDSGYVGRLYLAGDGSILITTNAVWNTGSTLWARDTGSESSGCFRLLGGALTYYSHPFSGSSSWSNTFNDPSHWGLAINLSADIATLGPQLYLGAGLPNTATGADIARAFFATTASQARSLLASIAGSGWAVKLYRSFASGADTFELAINAVWSSASSLWTQQAAGAPSRLFRFSSVGLDIFTQVDGSPAWADGAWASTAMRLSAVPSPASNVAPIINNISACQVAKAWGVVTTDGSGGVTLVEGFNIEAGDLGIIASSLVVGFLTNMPTTNYVVTPSVNLVSTSAWKSAQATGHSTGGFTISVFAESGGAIAQENLAAVARTIRFAVFAKE